MNIAAHQKEKNEKTGKIDVGEERKQSTDFKEAACYFSAVVQRAARRKNGLYKGGARGNWDPRNGQQPFRPNPNWVGYRTATLRRLLIGADQFAIDGEDAGQPLAELASGVTSTLRLVLHG